MTEEQGIIWEHREEDPVKLALSAAKHPGLPPAYLARQVGALQKIRNKIPSWYRPGLEFPVALSVEQASSEATAKFKAALVSGNVMADLTGGLGVDASFFALQFKQVHYVEINPAVFEAAQHNFKVLGLNILPILGDAEYFLNETSRQFDLLYLDPARRDDRKGKVFRLEDCTPNVLKIKDLLLGKAPTVLIKTAPLLDINQAIRQLGQVSKVWVLEYEGDCREVLYLLEREAVPKPTEVSIMAASLDQMGKALHRFSFTMETEQNATPPLSAPSGFLYEPMPAILKAGAFKSFAQQFNLNKLHPNTHLYTSIELVPNLPARSFRILAVCKYDKKTVAEIVPQGKANVATRNFPENTEQVRKKLGLSDGGEVYVFACTNHVAEKVIVVCLKA